VWDSAGDMTNATQQTQLYLNDFFVQVQAKAFRQAEIATGSRDEALDIVQDAMIKLASKYSHKREAWPQLFQRILQNAIRDWFRRRKVRRWFSWSQDDESEPDELQVLASSDYSPEALTHNAQQLEQVETALRQLPQRQQQAFILRAWWGANIEETAFAMACSTGSVKTHYSRAQAKLKILLEDVT